MMGRAASSDATGFIKGGGELIRSDSAGGLRLVAVRAESLKRLIPFVRAFYAHFGYPYDEREKVSVLRKMLRDTSIGRVWLIEYEDRAVGYILVAFSFSLEFDGRIAFLDELFIEASGRDKGLGVRVLEKVEDICRRRGIKALRLESEVHNERATALYARLGFVDHARHLMTKRLGG
jgi:GNAT superfamily N-acetyltransferase